MKTEMKFKTNSNSLIAKSKTVSNIPITLKNVREISEKGVGTCKVSK
jgi:hypothetical protein